MTDFLTTKEAGDILGQPEWRIRRIVDSLGIAQQRFGGKRLVPRTMLPNIIAALQDKGLLGTPAATA